MCETMRPPYKKIVTTSVREWRSIFSRARIKVIAGLVFLFLLGQQGIADVPTGTEIQCKGNADGTDITLNLQLLPTKKPFSVTLDSRYFDQRFLPKNNSSSDALLISMKATTFEPWPDDVLPHQKYGPYLSYLITTYNPIEEIAQFYAKTNQGYKISEAVNFIEEPAPYDLSLFTAPFRQERERKRTYMRNEKIFISRDDKKSITDVIVCHDPTKTPYSSCEHFMEMGLADVQVSYPPNFLKNWRDISQNAKSFFACITSSKL